MITGAPGIRSLILEQFEPEHARGLADFSNHLASLDVDIVMFMARKSYCLFDLLRSLGLRTTQKPIVTDRMLDQDLDRLRGKTVALVDDTVILGTTLARAKAKLEDAGARVQVHALAVNRETIGASIREYLDFAYVGMELSYEALATLCTNEVIALGTFPRPYLVDFPLSQQVKLDSEGVGALLSGITWQAHNLSTDVQSESRAWIYTFLPLESERERLTTMLGIDVARCVDISKVRCFGRLVGSVLRVTFVPLVTLRPLSTSGASGLAEHLVRLLGCQDSAAVQALLSSTRSSHARFRLSQYILSLVVGAAFFQHLGSVGVSSSGTVFIDQEAHIHFGPWSRQALIELSEAAAELVVASRPSGIATSRPLFSPVALPERAATWMEAFLSDTDAPNSRLRLSVDRSVDRTEIVEIDMAEAFLAMFERYELPARAEAKEHGLAGLMELRADQVDYRDRLENGIAWRPLAAHLAKIYRIAASGVVRNTLSLSLDRLNDLGVAVPIVKCQDGVVYRAYRHGEDVTWHDAECDLAYEMTLGLLEATGWESVPSLLLEKSLVTLLLVGTGERFLKGRPDATSAPPAAKVTYGLHGAVVSVQTRTLGAGRNSEWLRGYLVDRGVLRIDKTKRYSLGERLRATQSSRTALDRAYSVGALIGRAVANPSGGRLLTDADLVALTTCRTSHTTLQAIDAELSILHDWWSRRSRTLVHASLRERSSAAGALKLLRASPAKTALNSASAKAEYWATKRWRIVVDEVAQRLGHDNPRDARDWRSFWGADLESVASGVEERVLGTLLNEFTLVWTWLSDIAQLEASLSAIADEESVFRVRLGKIVAALDAQSRKLEQAGASEPPSLGGRRTRLARWAERTPSSPDAIGVVSGIVGNFENRLDELERVLSSTGRLLGEYGRLVSTQKYYHVVWYDIIDSTGGVWSVNNGESSDYRSEVAGFRSAVTETLKSIRIRCRKDGGDMHVWEGDPYSRNDSKNIAFTGDHSESWALTTLRELANLRGAHPHVNFRSIIVHAHFAGSDLVCIVQDGIMEGIVFMEHLSRAQMAFRRLAQDFSVGVSPVLLLGDAMATSTSVRSLRLSKTSEEYIETSTGSRSVTSKGIMGVLPSPNYSY